jgi:hypothetical protein
MAQKKKKSVAKPPVEWIGGVVTLPAYVPDEQGEPFRPLAALWLSADGLVLGMEVLGRSVEPGQVGASFLRTTRAPMVGRPHVPAQVRVASPEVARELGAHAAGVAVVCAATPEVDAMMAILRQGMAEAPDEEDDDEDDTYLTAGISAEAMESFFRTAARFHRAAPWKVIPGDTSLLEITIEALDVRGLVVSIIGQMGESFGLVCFGSFDDFEAYVVAAETIDEDESPKLPHHVALNFDRGADISPALRTEISAQGWEVADATAYPWIVVVDEDLVARPPTARELTRMEAIAAAIAWLVETEPDLPAAWKRPAQLRRTTTVAIAAGPVEVGLATLSPWHALEPAAAPAAAKKGKTAPKAAGKRR